MSGQIWRQYQNCSPYIYGLLFSTVSSIFCVVFVLFLELVFVIFYRLFMFFLFWPALWKLVLTSEKFSICQLNANQSMTNYMRFTDTWEAKLNMRYGSTL